MQPCATPELCLVIDPSRKFPQPLSLRLTSLRGRRESYDHCLHPSMPLLTRGNLHFHFTPLLAPLMFLSIPATKFKKRTLDQEATGHSRKRPKSGRSISQQLYESAVHDTPWDDDLDGAPTGLSKEEESSIREMMPDVKEMARDADAHNGPVCQCFRPFLGICIANAYHSIPLPSNHDAEHELFPCMREDNIH